MAKNFLKVIQALEDDCKTIGVNINRSKIIELYNQWKKSKFDSWMDFLSNYLMG